MKKITLILFYCLSGFVAMSQNTGFFNEYIPNLQQYSQQSFYVDGPDIIVGGNTFAVVTQAPTIMVTDTNGNFKNMWTLTSPDLELYRAHRMNTGNCVITGTTEVSSCGISGNGFVGSFNYTTGTYNGAVAYNSGVQLTGFCNGAFIAEDGIGLANGDIASVGPMDQTVACCLGASSYGQYNCGIGSIGSGGIGYFAGAFGTNNYERGQDICLIRSGTNGDTATASGGDGFVKKYSLAYSGGAGCGYGNPAQPTPPGHTTGTFVWVSDPVFAVDSTRQDIPLSVVEDVNHNLFICGYTYNYSSNNDYEGFILKVNSAGATQWCHTFYLVATASAYEEMVNMAFVTEDGSNDIVCAMQSYQSDNTEVVRIANGTGNVVWANSYSMGTQTWPWGIHLTTNKTTGTGYNEYLLGVIGVNFPGAPGSYDMAMLVIDDKGNLISSIGEGIAPEDGPDWSPDVDQAGTGSYFVSSNTPYTGGTTNGTLVAKINRQNNTIGCATYEFPVTVTTTPRIIGGANQVHERAPVIYETRGGATETPIAVTVAAVTPFVPSINCTCSALTVSASATTPTVCTGGNTNLTASGASTYTWSPSAGLSATTGTTVNATPASTTTYTVTGTDPGGCAPATGTVVVTVTAPPTIVITPSGSTTFCNGGSVNLVASGGTSYTWSPATGLSATTGATVTANPASSQTYTVTGSNGSCTNTSSVSVTISPAPTLTASASAPTICSGSPTTLTATGGASYTWTPNTSLSATTGSPVTATPASSITYTLNGTSALGCAGAPQTVSITVNATPTISVSATSPTICSGNSDVLNATGATSYTWTPNTDLSATTGTPVTATPLSNITYTITGTTGGCTSAQQTLAITVNPTPTITASASLSTICSGNPTTLSASGATTYSWTPNTNLSATTGTPVTATPSSNITYSVTGTTGGCTSAPITLPITVNTTPTLTASASASSVCPGNPTTLTATGAATYTWTPNTSLSATTGSPVTANPTSSITYTLNGTSAAGCAGVLQTVPITVNPSPVLTVSASATTICSGNPTTLTAGGGSSYTWTPNVALSATTGSPVIATPTTTTDYTVNGTSALGCAGTPQSIDITVNPTPNVSIAITGISPAVCSGDTVGMIAFGATTYTWSPSAGLNVTTGVHVIATPTVTTTYTLTGTGVGGCTSTATQTIVIYPLPTAAVTPPTSTICSGTTVPLTASGTATSFDWIPATGLSATTGTNVNATPSVTETYSVVGISVHGCKDTVTALITVNPTPTITIAPGSPTICPGNSVNLIASGATSYTWTPSTNLSATTGANVTATPTATITYSVTGTTGSCVSSQNVTVTVASGLNVTVTPSSPNICLGGNVVLNANGAGSYTWKPAAGLSCTTCSNPTATIASTATYTVVGVSGSCSDSANVTVTVNPIPTLTVTPSGGTTFCSGGSVIFTAAGASTYTWSPATGLSATTGATVTASPTSSQTYTVTGTSVSGCIATETVTVSINPNPTVSIIITGISPAVCAGDTVGLIGTGASSYTWAPGTGLSATTGTHVIASPGSTTIYTVTGTNGSGCTATSNITVTIYPTPTVTVTPGTASICSGASTGLTAGGATTYIWSPSASLSASSGASVNATPAATQTYTVIGKTGSGCIDSATAVVTVTPTPTVNIAPGAPTICPGGSVNLIATGATTYAWTPSTALDVTTGASVNANPTVTTTYSITGTNGTCTSNQTVVVTVASTLNVTVTPPSPSVCLGDSITLSANGAALYTWKTGTGLSCTTCSNPTSKPGANITYTVVGTSGTCADSATVTLTVNPVPVISVAPPSPTICPGGNVVLTASGGSTYTWSPSSSLNASTGTSVTATPASTQIYTVTGTNGTGCSDTASVDVVVGAGPVVSIAITGISPAVCAGDTVGMIATGAATYTWSPSTGLSATTGIHVVASPDSTTTYTVTGTSLGGCLGTATQIITIYPTPTVTVVPSAGTMCGGDSVTITASGGTSYSWSPSTGLSASTGAVVTATPTATTTYTITGKSAGGCSALDSVTITVTPLPVVTVTPPSAGICTGDSVVLTAGGGTTYAWTPSTGLSVTTGSTVTAIPGSTTIYTVTGTNGGCNASASVAITVGALTVTGTAVSPTICSGGSTVINAAGATTYTWFPSADLSASTGTSVTATPTATTTYTLVGQSSSSCVDTTQVTVTVGGAPVIGVSASSNTICSGTATILTATGGTTYTWSPAATLSASTGTIVSATPAASQTYTVVGTTAGGCSDSNTITINVNTTPTVTISSSGSDSICSGQNVTLTANGGTSPYLWSNGATTSSITVDSTGVYQIVSGNGICKDSTQQSVLVYAPFVVTMKSDSVCIGQNATVSVNATGGKPGYNYAWGSGLGTGPGPKTVAPASSGTYYVCTVTNGCGGSVTDSDLVYTYPTPKVSFTPSPDTILTGQFVTFINTSTGTTNYFWTLGDNTTSTDSMPYHEYANIGDYVVTLTASNGGCRDSVSDTVYVIQTIFIPNVFTPNGDGINDVFHVTMSGMQTYYIEIFNRWGEKVFSANSPEIDWDGRSMGGVEESDGTYYYEIKATDFTNQVHNYKGPIQLIR